MRKIFLVLSVISLVIGVVAVNQPIIMGLGKAMAGVFFILYFMLRLFQDFEADEAKH